MGGGGGGAHTHRLGFVGTVALVALCRHQYSMYLSIFLRFMCVHRRRTLCVAVRYVCVYVCAEIEFRRVVPWSVVPWIRVYCSHIFAGVCNVLGARNALLLAHGQIWFGVERKARGAGANDF